MKGIIYKATNIFNGKVYIGQTVSGLAARRRQHMRDAASDHKNAFHLALYQYPDSFTWEIIDTFCGSTEEVIHKLNVAEEYHIIKYNSLNTDNGYNSAGGGYSSDKFAEHITRRAKAMNRQSTVVLQYDRDGNFLKEFESLNSVAAYLGKDKVQSSVLFQGFHYGYQWREKLGSIFPKKIEPWVQPRTKGRAVIVYDKCGNLYGRFAYTKEAEAATNTTAYIRPSVRDISLYDVHLRDYYFFADTTNPPEKISINVIHKKETNPNYNELQKKRVAAYGLDGNLIAVYESIADAHRKNNVSEDSIREFCRLRPPIILSCKCRSKIVWQLAEEGPKKHIEISITPKKEEYIRKMEHRIIQYTLDGEFVKVWDNASQAAGAGMESDAVLRKNLAGKTNIKNLNYQWRYYTENYPQNIGPYKNNTDNGGKAGRPRKVTTTPTLPSLFERPDDTIVEIDWKGNTVATYRDTAEAAEKSGFSQSYICNVLAGRIRHPKRKFKRI